MRSQINKSADPNEQIIFDTHKTRIPFEKKVIQYQQVERIMEGPKMKQKIEYIQVERLDSQNRIVIEKVPKKVVEQKIVQTIPREVTLKQSYQVEYKSCATAILDKLRLNGHQARSAAIQKNQKQISQIQSKQKALSEEQAQQMRDYMEKNNKLIQQLQEEIRNLKDKIKEIDAKLTNLALLEKYLMPKIKIKEKLCDLQKNNQRQFIYIRCLHRSLNCFFQSVFLSNSNYLQVNNPHEYSNVKKIASKISELVADIPAVSTVFSVASASLTFVLEAKEQLKLEETKAKINKLISVSSGHQLDADIQKLSISILDSLIQISSTTQKAEEMKNATENPKNFESYRDLSWIEEFSGVYDSFRTAIAGGKKSKSAPNLTALYADWDYAKVMTCLFDLDDSKISNFHDLLSQALDPSVQDKLGQGQQKEGCCSCSLI